MANLVARFTRASGDSVEEQLRVLQENLERFTTEINKSAPGGGIWVYGNSTTITATLNVWTKINIFDSVSDSDGITPDLANNKLIIEKAGVHFVSAFITFLVGSSNESMEFSVFRSDGQLQSKELTGTARAIYGSQRVSCCLGGPVRLNAGDALELFGKSLISTTVLTVEHANFSAEWRRP